MIPTQYIDQVLRQRSHELIADADARRATRSRRGGRRNRGTRSATSSTSLFGVLHLRT
jgi:hypothetical protein